MLEPPFEDEDTYGLGILDSHDGVRPAGHHQLQHRQQRR